MSRHLHFMGAGGVGMCGLAEIFRAGGFQVSGCDLELSGRTARLENLGIPVAMGHDPGHLAGVDVLVVTSAVNRAHPEVAAALGRKLPVARRAEMLAELMRDRRGVAVAGTHGKTTTTALVGHLLERAGLEPTVVVGGHARFLDSHGRLGSGDVLVCEADEFDRSFLELAPTIAVITNLEPEHLDCYEGVDDLQASFVAFANRCSPFGAVILCGDDPGARTLIDGIRRRVVSYGLNDDVDLRAVAIEATPNGSKFSVETPDGRLGEIFLPIPGQHNVCNALAAVAVGLEMSVPFDQLAAACKDFGGVARRFERLGERDGVTVFDDYAHHPTEVRAVLAAARQAMPGRRLVTVFQPHLYSRTRDFADAFGDALTDSDIAVVLPIYPAREEPIPGVDSRIVVDAALHRGHPSVIGVGGMDEGLEWLSGVLGPGDVLLTLGAGDVYRLAEFWLGGTR